MGDNSLQTGEGGLAIVNIGEVISGDIDRPILAGVDSVVCGANGNIEALGTETELVDRIGRASIVVDANGGTVAPGLIDSHCHVVLGDYTPRQQAIGFLESYTHGGITRVISAGEIHAAGLPQNPIASKALAITARMCFNNFYPGGMQVHAGTVLLTPGLKDEDFVEMRAQGVELAKFGFGAYRRALDGITEVQLAQQNNIKVMAHSGGPTAPTSAAITSDDLLGLAPDIYGHVNGGPTSLSDDGIERLVREGRGALQLVQAGNLASALRILALAREEKQLSRIVVGSDSPTGTGVIPLGVLKTVAELSSLGAVPPEITWCFATGNNAKIFNVAGGVLKVGAAADIVIMDAPLGCVAPTALKALERGDLPGVSAVVIAGKLRVLPSRNSPIPARRASVRTSRSE